MVGRDERFGRRALLFGSVLAALGGPANARPDDSTCRGYGALSDNPVIRLGQVTTAMPRTNFLKDSDDDGACPSATAACRAKAFLVPGNLVILGRTRGAFVCADYVGAKGQERTGWLPSDAVAPVARPQPSAADWTGKWTREEATIIVKPGPKAGEIAVKGDATYGAKDPDRVRRVAVNIGNIEGTVAPAGGDASFAMGQDDTLPVDKGGEFDCKVWMKRLGPWLLVDDNNNCGGANVTFRGTYARRR